ncbi:SGNH/GDSL hydrolase family protein [Microbacterium ulmi]|uniref:SGNH/GDSL hydrolase family protein n=1 Tax=Microbacterium ulmi TaxID=179095 RepID=A0A7Y2M138_9MICO|nr:SGNH/GDSL hydrolase family protein [Microbacterium ulmi]NII69459.1 lysophospholipase L1-like esterase [Microbacterium ulmi]NNH04417.1 SGNH/GDSL hydrolase family protein [Microbacterium ulmi]
MRPRPSGAPALTVLLLATVLAVAGCAPQPADAGSPPSAEPSASASFVPGSLVVIGDSMSLGVASCGAPEPCLDASWAVGTDPSVDSISQRLTSRTGTAPATAAIAQLGAGVSFADAAVDSLSQKEADLVLVLLGANDACTSSMDAVTSADDFAAGYAALLTGVRQAAPEARIVAFSVPDLLRLWELGRDDPAIAKAWGASPSCRSLLGNADSDAAADVARRAEIGALLDAYDDAIARACAATAGCTFDDGAVHGVVFQDDDVSEVDHFHASRAGQATLAAAAWPAVEQALGG